MITAEENFHNINAKKMEVQNLIYLKKEQNDKG